MEVALIFSPYKTQYNIIRDLLKLPMHPENQSCNFPGNQNGESFIPPLTHQIFDLKKLSHMWNIKPTHTSAVTTGYRLTFHTCELITKAA